MNKKPVVLSILFYAIICLVAVESYSGVPSINLNNPGVLKRIQKENPEHYRKILGILDGINKQPESRVPHWIQAKFNARDILYGPVLLTSLPPKKHISFTLDNTHYEALLTMTDFGLKII